MKTTRRASLIFMAGVVAAMATPFTGAVAQDANWPSRTIRIVVPFPPGATPDIMARVVADQLAKRLDQSVIVENKPGGSGIIALGAVQNADADGYTLLLADTGHMAINPAMRNDLPYDALKDFVPVTRMTEQNFSIIVRADFPGKTINDLVKLSKERQLKYGTPGIGSVHHIASERLKNLTGADFMHVPYKGMIHVVPALLAGDVDFHISSATPVLGQWKDGKVRILARGSNERGALMPDVPTLKESGVPLTVAITLGMFAPAGTPPAIVDRLSREVNAVLVSDELKQRTAGQDFTVAGTTPDEYAAIVKQQFDEYRDVMREVKIEP